MVSRAMTKLLVVALVACAGCDAFGPGELEPTRCYVMPMANQTPVYQCVNGSADTVWAEWPQSVGGGLVRE